MERIVLAVILVAALAALARIAWRSLASANRQASPACRGCPLAGECGGHAGSEGRPDGRDHGR
jgi:hypothetical protein